MILVDVSLLDWNYQKSLINIWNNIFLDDGATFSLSGYKCLLADISSPILKSLEK